MKKLILRWGPAALVMAVIFFFSSVPSAAMPNFGESDTLIKKLGHASEYALLLLALERGYRPGGWRGLLVCWLGLVLFALSDEFHQRFVAGRNSTIVDVGIDSLGGMAAVLGLGWAKKRRKGAA